MAISVEDAQALARPRAVKSAAGKTNTTQDMGDRFLTLLVTQMRNQDPLNPLQNAEVTSQLAQISTVTGVDKLNTTIENMSKAMAGTQSLQASALVGHGVLAPGGTLDLTAAGSVGGIDLKEPAEVVNVKIFDSKGLAVATLALNAKPEGVSGFTWDGKDKDGIRAPDGVYTFEVEATSNGGKVEAARLAHTMVRSVTLGGSEIVVNTKTLGSLLLSDVKQIF